MTASAATSVGVAAAGTGLGWFGDPPVTPVVTPVDGVKGGGRALIAEPITAVDLGGALPFALARVGELPSLTAGQALGADGAIRSLSPIRDVTWRGFVGGLKSLADDQLFIDEVVVTADGVAARHMLWSHLASAGGTSAGATFTAHDDAFAGLEVTRVAAATGKRSSAFFAFAASGAGPQLKPGVYVLAGPRASTGLPPASSDHAFTGSLAEPLQPSRLHALDFPYLTFAVYGEWV